jgi:hypothetical protein
MPLTCDSRVAKASGELVQRAKPVLTSYTSRRALESGPKWRLRAVSIAKELALRAGWSWSICTKRRVSIRAFGGVFSALRAKAVLGWVGGGGGGAGRAACWAYVRLREGSKGALEPVMSVVKVPVG